MLCLGYFDYKLFSTRNVLYPLHLYSALTYWHSTLLGVFCPITNEQQNGTSNRTKLITIMWFFKKRLLLSCPCTGQSANPMIIVTITHNIRGCIVWLSAIHPLCFCRTHCTALWAQVYQPLSHYSLQTLNCHFIPPRVILTNIIWILRVCVQPTEEVPTCS